MLWLTGQGCTQNDTKQTDKHNIGESRTTTRERERERERERDGSILRDQKKRHGRMDQGTKAQMDQWTNEWTNGRM